MSSNARYLGLDITPWGLVFVLLDKDGAEAGSLRRSFGEMAGPGEHEPADWWRAVRTGIKELLRRTGVKPAWVRAIGLTGTHSGCVLLDEDGKVLFPALMGSSPRLHAYLDQVRELVGARNLANLTGCGTQLTSAALAPKLLAIRDIAPRVWHDLRMVFQPRDYLRFRLTGEQVTDASMASRSLLFSPRNMAWSKQVIERLGMEPDWFCKLAEGPRISGRISEQAARDTGLSAGTPVVTGGSHAACAAVATGVVDSGQAVVELGSNGHLFCVQAEARRDTGGCFHLGCHTIPDRWCLERPQTASGAGIAWLAQELLVLDVQQARRARRDPLEHLCELASEVSPGADRLTFIPPAGDMDRAHLLGLSYKHGKGHLIRAVLESAALTTAWALRQARSNGFELQRLVVTGPGSKVTLWSQILADAIAHDIEVIKGEHLCARGAAILASTATGAHQDLRSAIAASASASVHLQPRSGASDIYARRLEQLPPIHEALASRLDGDEMP